MNQETPFGPEHSDALLYLAGRGILAADLPDEQIQQYVELHLYGVD